MKLVKLIGTGVKGLALLTFVAVIACGGGGGDDGGSVSPAVDPYAIDYGTIQYRNFESGATSYFVLVALTDNGGPVAESDVVDAAMYNSLDADMTPKTDGFSHTQKLVYDAIADSTSEQETTGVMAIFNDLAEDIYSVDVDMENGQLLNTDIDVPAKVTIPPVQSATMSNSWSAGDLELSWTNPNSATWDNEVDELRIVVDDDQGSTVLWVEVAPLASNTAQSVVIPAAVVAQAATYQTGTYLNEWLIQGRALDGTTSKCFSVSLSNMISITPP